MAQQVEQFTRNEQVASSNLASSSTLRSKGNFAPFFCQKKLRPNPCSFAITKSHARFDCSVVNALATSHCRYQLFARVLAMLVELYLRGFLLQGNFAPFFIQKTL